MIDNTASHRLTILYGSQTGTAQDVAERVYRQAYCRRFTICISDLDSYSIVSRLYTVFVNLFSYEYDNGNI